MVSSVLASVPCVLYLYSYLFFLSICKAVQVVASQNSHVLSIALRTMATGESTRMGQKKIRVGMNYPTGSMVNKDCVRAKVKPTSSEDVQIRANDMATEIRHNAFLMGEVRRLISETDPPAVGSVSAKFAADYLICTSHYAISPLAYILGDIDLDGKKFVETSSQYLLRTVPLTFILLTIITQHQMTWSKQLLQQIVAKLVLLVQVKEGKTPIMLIILFIQSVMALIPFRLRFVTQPKN